MNNIFLAIKTIEMPNSRIAVIVRFNSLVLLVGNLYISIDP